MSTELSTLHKILARQLKREFGGLDRVPAKLWPLLEAVSATYAQADEERWLLEHSMVTLSEELVERYERSREHERAYRLLFESNPAPMWVYDPESLHFLAVNDAAVRRYGWSREEFLERSLLDIRSPEDARLFRDAVRPGTGLVHAGLYRHRTRDGSLLDVEITSHDVFFAGRPARLVLAVDVTERLRWEGELRDSEQRYRAAAEGLGEALSLLQATLESTADGILVVGTDGRFSSWNRRFLEMWRLTEADVASRDGNRLMALVLPQLRYPDDWAASVLALRGESEEESFDVVEFVDGRIFERYSRPQRVDGRIVGRVWSFRDVTARARAEEELRHAQKMNAVGRLAGGVAHDFNNILTVIRNNAELCLLALDEGHRVRADLEQIVAAADRATALTGQLLAFGRKQVWRPRVLDLNAAVADAERLLRRLLPADITIVARLDPAAPRVLADPGHVEQVLMNLAVNARDAMSGGGTLTLATAGPDAADGDPRDGDARGWVTLVVADTGHGMDAETRARAFEPFFTTKGPGQGTGLGLATVYGIAEQAGGRVTVESEPGAGAVFTIWLPAAPAGATDGATVRRTSGGFALEPRAGAPATVLLVEDEDAVRLALRRTLERGGYRVVEARHGAEALQRFEASAAAPDLVLTDVVMPVMGGRELVEMLRARHPALRVLFVSAYTDWDSAPAALGDGRTDFLPKPSPTDAVLAKVAELLAR